MWNIVYLLVWSWCPSLPEQEVMFSRQQVAARSQHYVRRSYRQDRS